MIAAIDSTNFWIQFVAGIVVVGGGVTAGARWLVQHIAEIANDKIGIDDLKESVQEINQRLARVESQYSKNSGSSMRDAIDRLEEGQRYIRADILRIDKALERHLGAHEGLE